MKILRWVGFLPSFILYVVVGQSIIEWLCGCWHKFAFPVTGVLHGILSFGIIFPFLLTGISFFIMGLNQVIRIAPNTRTGSIIILIVMIVFYGSAYLMNNNDKLNYLRIILDVLVFFGIGLYAIMPNENEAKSPKEV